MSLWVWENVLSDFTDGMVCVLAPDEETAWALLEEKDPTARKSIGDHEQRPREVTAPEAFVCWGGG